MRGHQAAKIRVVLPLYLAASLLHFAHNAEYLADYPNLPASLTRAGVYAAWTGVTTVGLVGYVALKRHRRVGLAMLVVYGVLGLGGLDHYVLASPMAHTSMMNLTIWLEVVSALALLIVVAITIVRSSRAGGNPTVHVRRNV